MGSRAATALPVALAVAVALMATAGPVYAHTPGAQPVVREGNFTLGVGAPENEYHVYFLEMGFPIEAGDTFEIQWSVNGGQGPEVSFEIHTHENGWTRYYTTNASSLDLVWVVPQANDSFMVFWVNPWRIPVNVSYNIVDKARPADLTPLLVLPLAVGAAFGWFLWLRSVPDEEQQDVGGRRGPLEQAPGREPPPDDEGFQRAVEEAESAKSGAGRGDG